MAKMKVGSKSDVFLLDEDHTWLCSTGLPSDVVIDVGEKSFHLHKFPLISRSEVLEKLIGECSTEDEKKCYMQLNDIPGGAKAFLLVAKFCYGVKMELTTDNVVTLRCAAEYLDMNEDCYEGNLIAQTENFLSEIFGNWTDTLKALETCEEVLSQAEELDVVSRCITSLAMKACADPSLFSWPMQVDGDPQRAKGPVFWNGICATSKPYPVGDGWWYKDASILRFPLYKRLIVEACSIGMKPERVVGSVMYYAKSHLPLMGRQANNLLGNYTPSGNPFACPDVEQKNLLEEIVELLPDIKGVTPSKFLLSLLRTAMVLHASPSCIENLERRIGAQLDQAALEDILIPNLGYSVETLYDIDCVHRILDHFMLVDRDDDHHSSHFIVEEGQFTGGSGSHPLTPLTMVANLIDSYLAEVAPDVNLKLEKFISLASLIPDYSRPLDDGIYRAIDIYLKAHPMLMDSERENLCKLMNCQKFSLEASTHAAQNERLPLRVIVQVLFFEQLRLRTSISGWFFVSDNLENSQNPSRNLALTRNDVYSTQPGGAPMQDDHIVSVDGMKERVFELEKECLSMKQEIEKLVKTKGSWNVLRKLGFLKPKPRSSSTTTIDPNVTKLKNSKESSAPVTNGGDIRNCESRDHIGNSRRH